MKEWVLGIKNPGQKSSFDPPFQFSVFLFIVMKSIVIKINEKISDWKARCSEWVKLFLNDITAMRTDATLYF